MDFEFPPDALMLQDMLRRFIQKEARPLEMKYFNEGSLSQEERDRLRRAIEQLGLWGLTVPEEYGGGGLDLVTTCLIEEELGTTFVPVEIGEVPPMLYACVGEQVPRVLEPALAGKRACNLFDQFFHLLNEKIEPVSQHADFVLALVIEPHGQIAFPLCNSLQPFGHSGHRTNDDTGRKNGRQKPKHQRDYNCNENHNV